MPKKLAKDALGLTVSATTLTVGSSLVGGLGGGAVGAAGLQGLTTLSRAQTPVASILGAKAVFRGLKKLK